jgi:hypothetical protein
MSAAEIIAILDTLPPAEQQQVREYLDQKLASSPSTDIRRMDLAKGKVIGEALFDRHSDLFRRLAQ